MPQGHGYRTSAVIWMLQASMMERQLKLLTITLLLTMENAQQWWSSSALQEHTNVTRTSHCQKCMPQGHGYRTSAVIWMLQAKRGWAKCNHNSTMERTSRKCSMRVRQGCASVTCMMRVKHCEWHMNGFAMKPKHISSGKSKLLQELNKAG